MGIYSKYILPILINKICGDSLFTEQRNKIIPLAYGNVLEIGVGTGHNLPVYDGSKVTKLTAIEPTDDTWKQCKMDLKSLPFGFEFIIASAEELPFEDDSFDTVVITYTLCTIPDVEKALEEMRRVLKPTGILLFSEHGLAPDKRIRFVQNSLNPVWKQFSGGCNLNRNISQLIEESGFEITKLEQMYISGFKTGSYNYLGTATKA